MAGMPPAPAAEPTPTTTGYTLLGLLSFGRELSGYELKRWSENLRFFWSAPAMSQVYREIERLAAGGYVEQRHVVRDGTRATKVYNLTPAGERALRAWLAEPPDPPMLKHPVALRVFFGHLMAPDDLQRAIEAHRDWCERTLADLARVRRDLGDDSTFRNAALVAEWGLDYFRGELAAARGIEGMVTTHDPTGGGIDAAPAAGRPPAQAGGTAAEGAAAGDEQGPGCDEGQAGEATPVA